MVERTAHNGLVVGSSPTKPKNLSLYKMDHNLKKYRVLKVKNNFKNSDLLFFYHSFHPFTFNLTFFFFHPFFIEHCLYFIRHRVFYPRPNELDQLYQGFCRRLSPNLFSFHLNPSLFKPFIPILQIPIYSTPLPIQQRTSDHLILRVIHINLSKIKIIKVAASFSFELSCT